MSRGEPDGGNLHPQGATHVEADEAVARRRSRTTRRVVFAMLLAWLGLALLVVLLVSLG
ncbi:MAG: hypothetical protein ACRDZX_01470 [Acidimicrobiales bacterium]